MYLWKVKCSTTRSYLPQQLLRLQYLGPCNVKVRSKSSYNEYYATVSDDDLEVREAITAAKRPMDTVRKIKLIGAIRNTESFVNKKRYDLEVAHFVEQAGAAKRALNEALRHKAAAQEKVGELEKQLKKLQSKADKKKKKKAEQVEQVEQVAADVQ